MRYQSTKGISVILTLPLCLEKSYLQDKILMDSDVLNSRDVLPLVRDLVTILIVIVIVQ